MATGESGSNRQGFGKVLQRKVTRTKEKVSFCLLYVERLVYKRDYQIAAVCRISLGNVLARNYRHFGPMTLRTLDTSALVWWVRTVRTDRHWCRSVLKTSYLSAELSCPSVEVSYPVFDDYGM